MSNTEAKSRYGRSLTTKADVPAAPAANTNGRSGRQQLEAAITLPTAARLENTVLAEPDLFLCWFSSTRAIFASVRAVHSVQPREQRTTVLMLDFPLKTQLTIAVAQCPSELRFQTDKILDLLTHIAHSALEHRSHIRTGVMFLPQRQ